ncbi:hypothetical protein ACA910_014012 [Epithemia clementina (nom. ined.)]
MLVEEKNVRFEEDKPRKGWLFRRSNGRRTAKTIPEAEQSVSILSDKYNKFNKHAEQEPEYQTRTMVVHPRAKSKKDFKLKKELVLEQPPSAREAAFGGPVRYDWIDIETTAAIKVQAAYRRNKVMNDLEREGYSTGAIRNRARRRIASATSSFFDCCGTNFTFADFGAHDREAHREYQKMVYQEQKKARFYHEEELRLGFSKKHRMRQSERNRVDEAFEIVE